MYMPVDLDFFDKPVNKDLMSDDYICIDILPSEKEDLYKKRIRVSDSVLVRALVDYGVGSEGDLLTVEVKDREKLGAGYFYQGVIKKSKNNKEKIIGEKVFFSSDEVYEILSS